MSTRRVLVSAGAEKQALAAVRSLGRQGFAVDVVATQPNAPAFRSRWCRAAWISPPTDDRDAYLEFLLKQVCARDYLTVLPCDDATAELLSRHRDAFAPHVRLALPAAECFETALDKERLVAFAAARGIPVPRTRVPSDVAEADALAAELGFPLILKGAHGWGAQHVRLVHDAAQLHPNLQAIRALEGGRLPMLQEFVPGTGYGFSTLFRHGEPRAIFLHRRHAEYDVSRGGTPYSCPVAESVDDPTLRAQGQALFAALGWHGLGMAEWRRDTRDGRFVLMEINPRLVGSTDLAVHCGVDLPGLACRMLLAGDVEPVLEHPAGKRLRWLLPDGLQDLLARPRAALRDHLARTPHTASDWCWSDPAPHWMQLRLAAWQLRQRRGGRHGS